MNPTALMLLALLPSQSWDMQPRASLPATSWNMQPVTEHEQPEVPIRNASLRTSGWNNLIQDPPLAVADASPTPMAEVNRVLGILPKPEIAFVDLGCGYDARWCVAAAEKWGCKCVGIEINPERAAAAREHVRNLGLDHLIEIIHGDATEVEVQGDIGVAYLYADVLEALKPKLKQFRVFASYRHQPPLESTVIHGDTYLWYRPNQTAVTSSQFVTHTGPKQSAGQMYGWTDGTFRNSPQPGMNYPTLGLLAKPGSAKPSAKEMALTALSNQPQRYAYWQGQYYAGPVCTSRGCGMCNNIRQQLGL